MGTTSFVVATSACFSACPSPPPAATTRSCHGRRRGMSCRASISDDHLLRLDRRDVLAGLTGLAATAGGVYRPDVALAADGDVCPRGNKVTGNQLTCKPEEFDKPCPPRGNPTIVDFAPPSGPVRVRQPAHLADEELVEKYREAVAAMKRLPASDPRSFQAQSSIHQAYCDGFYRYDPAAQKAGAPFDVHFSWIFAPWHRMYIYFYERILGDLIGDPSFGLPYWNWDAMAGMALPAIFKEPSYVPASNNPGKRSFCNPLYDANRNPAHLDAYVALDFGKDDDLNIPFDPNALELNDVVKDNFATLYNQMIRQARGARCFLGEKFCTKYSMDVKSGTSGALERLAHTSVHVWVGNKRSCAVGHDESRHCGTDMGFLGTAARDPVFYSHHSNVDRMWHLWANMPLPGHRNFEDEEWLDTSFLFYDEKPQLVRIKVRDVLDVDKMGYKYAEPAEGLRWMNTKPTRRAPARKVGSLKPKAPGFPLELKVGQPVDVPGVARAPDAKAKGKLEVLMFDSIEFNPREYARFDVAVNVDPKNAAAVGPQDANFAGSFISLPRATSKTTMESKLELPLEDLLIDLNVADGTPVDFVLVPRTEGITIKSQPMIQATDC